MAVLGAQRWTPAEDDLIRETKPRTRAEVSRMARRLGRSRQAILHRVRHLRQRDLFDYGETTRGQLPLTENKPVT